MMVLEVMKHYPFGPVVQRKALSWLVSLSTEEYMRHGCCGEETAVSGLRNCMFDHDCLFLENCFVNVVIIRRRVCWCWRSTPRTAMQVVKG